MAWLSGFLNVTGMNSSMTCTLKTKLYFTQLRHFRKVLKRTPKMVLNEDEAQQHNYQSPFKSVHARLNAPRAYENSSSNEVEILKQVESATLPSKNKREKFDSKYDDIPPYEKLKEEDNDKFSKVMMLVKSRKEREKKQKILLEGKRLIKDAIDAGIRIENVYFSREETLAGLGLNKLTNVKIHKVLFNHLKLWSDLASCPGIMAVCKTPDPGKLAISGSNIPVSLICDNIREPGNMGAILRCAAAAGCNKVLATKGCVDVWDPKVLRGGAGSQFHVPIYNNIEWPLIKNYLPESFSVILAENRDPALEFLDQRAAKKIRDENEIKKFDYVEKLEDGRTRETVYENREVLDEYKNIPLPVYKYTDLGFSKDSHVALVIGGETEGLSSAAYKLAHDYAGFKATIPLANNIESLNAAAAAAVLLFEISRQLNTTQ